MSLQQSLKPTLQEIRATHGSYQHFIEKAQQQLPSLRNALEPKNSRNVDYDKIENVVLVIF